MTIVLIDSWIVDNTSSLHISNIVVSSTYLYIGAVVSRSLIYKIKSLRPDTVPCGTPPLGFPTFDKYFPILTRWVRSNKKTSYPS